MGRKCRQYLRECLFTPFMGCAQIDHALHGLVHPLGALPGALGGVCHPRGEMTFPLRPPCGLPLCVLPIQPYPGERRSGLCLSGKAACAAGNLREGMSVWYQP